MDTHFNEVLLALTAERKQLREFVSLLQREQTALVENTTDELLELAEQKSTLALVLTKFVETRNALLRTRIAQLNADSIDAWLQHQEPQGLAIWQEILQLGKQARQFNQSSGELIQMKLRHNQQALTALGNAVNKANLYGPDGQTSFSTGGGRTITSA